MTFFADVNHFTRTRHQRFTLAATVVSLGLLAVALPSRAGVEEGRTKAQVCAACHGADGNSAMPGIPSLASQPKQFIVTALFEFREGKRANPVMGPMAASLSNTDFNDLAAYFASLPAKASGAAAGDAEAGKRLTVQNNCVACHSANLMGQQHIPRLAGQRAEYLRDQLTAFKATTRTDMDGTMTSAAQALSAQDIDVLANYLAGLTPAAPTGK
jgi:cytochrome c553